ncbi:MAG: hypothetical protein FWE82_07125 [Defluviitaleaceae bacterium]|nr:hypothetical protein [Defluviitaleaceae bacterium]
METKFLSTAIGSMPFFSEKKAVEVSLSRLDAPIWPQLPKHGLYEQMEIQYSENLPRAVIDEQKSRMYFDTTGDYSDEFADFYAQYMEVDEGGSLDGFAISQKYSRGVYALLDALKDGGKRPWVKVQTTGPCSFALTIVDENKRAVFYNEEFRDVIVKGLAMKCRWQLQKFAPYAENMICFIDEPILSAFGSSTYVSVKRDDVVALVAEMVEAVHAEKALAGVHCCGNTEWSILMDAGVDIVNFDAFEYGETIAIYADAVKKHLDRGGMLAWGVVPTSVKIREQTAESLEVQLEAMMDNLAAKGVNKEIIVKQALITPSCGTGSMDEADAERVFDLLEQLTRKMKAKYGF